MSIRTKLISLLIGSCFVSLLAACVAFVAFDRRSSSAAKQQTLAVLADAVAGSVAGAVAFGDSTSAELVLQTLAAEPTTEAAAVYSAQDGRLAGWARAQGATTPAPTAGALLNGYFDGRLVLMRPIKGAEGGEIGTLVSTYSTADLDARSLRFVGLAALVLLMATAASALAASRLHRVISAPVLRLARGAERVRDQGDYSVRVERTGDDELGVLTEAFNAMLAGIQSRDAELETHRQGLEDLVAKRTAALDQRNRAMKLVLDHVDQGLVTLDRAGRPSPERSASFERFFGVPRAEDSMAELLGRQHAVTGTWFASAWESVVEDVLPLELAIDQLPKDLQLAGRYYRLAYTPIHEQDALSHMLLIATDITSAVEKERLEAAQREFLDVVERMLRDRPAVEEFIEESTSLLARLQRTDEPRAEVMRALHTLKGNAAVFGLHSIAELCHRLETQLEGVATPPPDTFEELAQRWRSFVGRTHALLGQDAEHIHIERSDYESLLRAVHQHAPHELLEPLVRSWKLERLDVRLARLAMQASAVARRLGKPDVEIVVDAQDLRLPRERWAPLWASMVHVLRNALDHGVEATEERTRRGKLGPGTLTLRARLIDECVRVEVADDGRGVDWGRVRRRAQAAGIAAESQADLVAALFADGLSTAEAVSMTSGRGVGLGAVRAVCHELGVQLTVRSEPDAGTTFSFELPLDPPSAELARAWRTMSGPRASAFPRPRTSAAPRALAPPRPSLSV